LIGASYKGEFAILKSAKNFGYIDTHIDLLEEKKMLTLFGDFNFFGPKDTICGWEDMKIKKNAFSTLVLEFFCQSKFSGKRSKIQKIQNSTPPIVQLVCQLRNAQWDTCEKSLNFSYFHVFSAFN
jgi:hypothetical protein